MDSKQSSLINYQIILVFSVAYGKLFYSLPFLLQNIQSTNWQTMRFKPPPPNSDIGWRVEFRPMEVRWGSAGANSHAPCLLTAHHPLTLLAEAPKLTGRQYRSSVYTQWARPKAKAGWFLRIDCEQTQTPKGNWGMTWSEEGFVGEWLACVVGC